MIPNQITARIKELEDWLIKNPGHPNTTLIMKDKNELEKQLPK